MIIKVKTVLYKKVKIIKIKGPKQFNLLIKSDQLFAISKNLLILLKWFNNYIYDVINGWRFLHGMAPSDCCRKSYASQEINYKISIFCE